MWTWLSRFEVVVALLESVGVSGTVTAIVAVWVVYAWWSGRIRRWLDTIAAEDRRPAAVAALLVCVMAVLVGSIADQGYKDWTQSPSGFFLRTCEPGNTKFGCRVVNLPGEYDAPIIMEGIRISPRLHVSGDKEIIVMHGNFHHESATTNIESMYSSLWVPAQTNCWAFNEMPARKLMLVVLDDGRNSTQLGVISADGDGGAVLGPRGCDSESFREYADEITR